MLHLVSHIPLTMVSLAEKGHDTHYLIIQQLPNPFLKQNQQKNGQLKNCYIGVSYKVSIKQK